MAEEITYALCDNGCDAPIIIIAACIESTPSIRGGPCLVVKCTGCGKSLRRL